jgi:hypothetical protein
VDVHQEKTMRAFAAVILCVACTGASEGGIPDGHRLVTGKAALAQADDPQGQRQALQVVAVFAAAECGDEAIPFGEPFDPGEQGGGVTGEPFRLLLRCDTTVNLLVQAIQTSDAQAPGDPLAILAFPTGGAAGETTTLLPLETMGCRDPVEAPALATDLLDLGSFTVPARPPAGGPATVVLGGVEGGTNPLATVDTDGDATANVADLDDDEDAILDTTDDDADGDGAADDAQRFTPEWLD